MYHVVENFNMAKCRIISHFCVFQFQVIKKVEEGFRLPAYKVSIYSSI